MMCMIKLTVYHKILTPIPMYRQEILDRCIATDPDTLIKTIYSKSLMRLTSYLHQADQLTQYLYHNYGG